MSLALSCRNLLELAIFAQFVLQCKANADELAADRLIDTADIAIESEEGWCPNCNPPGDTADLDKAIRLCQKQIAEEGVDRDRYLKTSQLATKLNMRSEYNSVNTLCSKFVHPSVSLQSL